MAASSFSRFRGSVQDRKGGLAGKRLLVCLFALQVMFSLAAAAALIRNPSGLFHHPALQACAGCMALILTAATVVGTFRYIQAGRREMLGTRHAAELIKTVLCTSREWLWVVDGNDIFTFSSPRSAELLGYEPADLVGQPCSLVVEQEDLDRARLAVLAQQEPDGIAAAGVIVRCRHRDGRPVWVEVSSRPRISAQGEPAGFEGTSRLLNPATAQEAAAKRTRERITGIINGRGLLTAFQPIHDLETGRTIGVEALSRFVSDEGFGAEHWFSEASAVGLGTELEFAALRTALEAAEQLPPALYVALNISPNTCLDPRLPGILEDSEVSPSRLVLELTERLPVEEYGLLAAALEPLRRRGLRIAVDDAGSGFASMRHILQLRPDIIKLDRSLIGGISEDTGLRALGATMVEFARQINATLVAEGIETRADLATVTGLGMSAGQGYLLGRPSIQAREWDAWLHQDAFTGTHEPTTPART
jgi:PAS domain S-box-containing protein